MIDALFSIGGFGLITAIYFLAKYLLVDRHTEPKSMWKKVLGFGYITVVIVSQLIVNVLNSKELCSDTPQVLNAFVYTLFPNFFILGSLMMIMTVLPGWKAPFSNTIGYIVVWALGVNAVLIKLLKDKNGSKLMQEILSNKSLIINEMTRENFKLFMGKMATDKLLENGYKKLPAYEKLWHYVVIKDSISEFIWIMLAGSLVISTIYNNMLDMKCDIPPSKRKAAADAFEKKMKQTDKPKEKLFTVHD